ncbi:hypothetical protein [Arenimonas metalli]|uniref:Uncharacterized protein n=1 Tax=Arenimonas metalli CF5-1 TaxID=1384056 RepID=A0A091B337_9GAMM|nr:hypothetical protein [Arenimonas metalli]KFN45937.1 hypothetical protein N787_03025 [Arenimonas metalli CF5-1]
MIVLVGVLLLAVVLLTATLLHLLAEFAVARGVPATPLWRHAPALLRTAHAAARDASLDERARTAAGAAVLCAWLLLALFLAFALAAPHIK